MEHAFLPRRTVEVHRRRGRPYPEILVDRPEPQHAQPAHGFHDERELRRIDAARRRDGVGIEAARRDKGESLGTCERHPAARNHLAHGYLLLEDALQADAHDGRFDLGLRHAIEQLVRPGGKFVIYRPRIAAHGNLALQPALRPAAALVGDAYCAVPVGRSLRGRVVHIYRIEAVQNLYVPEFPPAAHASLHLHGSIGTRRARDKRTFHPGIDLPKRVLHPLEVQVAIRLDAQRPHAASERPRRRIAFGDSQLRQEDMRGEQVRHRAVEPHRAVLSHVEILRRPFAHDLPVRRLPAERYRIPRRLRRAVRNVAHLDLGKLARLKRLAVADHQVRDRDVVARERLRRTPGVNIRPIAQDALRNVSVGGYRTEMRVLVLLVPFRAQDEIGAHQRDRGHRVAQQARPGRIDAVCPATHVLVRLSHANAEELALELRLRHDGFHDRREDCIVVVRIETPVHPAAT